MMNYETRLLKFLQDNPKLRMTTKQIAGIWKRNQEDVMESAIFLYHKDKVNLDGATGMVSLLTCEGTGIVF
jgi:hypothetical protein